MVILTVVNSLSSLFSLVLTSVVAVDLSLVVVVTASLRSLRHDS